MVRHIRLKNMSRFIVFEGPEGAGKTTQANMLIDYLNGRGFKTQYHREPGATRMGQDVRRILLDCNYSGELTTTTELLLFAASYRDGIHKLILPALKDKTFVISDRTNISAFSYQRESPHIEYLLGLNDTLCCPDIVFLLLPDYETASKRCNDRPGYRNRNDDFDRKTHEYRVEGYGMYLEKFPERCVVIDPNLTVEQIHEEVISHLEATGPL